MEALKTIAMLLGGVTFFGLGYSFMGENMKPVMFIVPGAAAVICYMAYKYLEGKKR